MYACLRVLFGASALVVCGAVTQEVTNSNACRNSRVEAQSSAGRDLMAVLNQAHDERAGPQSNRRRSAEETLYTFLGIQYGATEMFERNNTNAQEAETLCRENGAITTAWKLWHQWRAVPVVIEMSLSEPATPVQPRATPPRTHFPTIIPRSSIEDIALDRI